MKKWLTILFLIFTEIGINAQVLLKEDFNYSGALLSNGWSLHSGNASPISTTTGLIYSSYNGSGIGSSANLAGTSDDINFPLSDSVYTNNESVYMTAMVNVTETSTQAGGYFLHLGNRSSPTSFTQFTARVYAKTPSAGVVNFGVSNANTGTYGTTNFATNTTYLLVVKYTINTGGNDPVKLWVFSSGIPTDEASAGTPEVDITTTAGTDIVDAVALRESSGIPKSIVDGIRIAKSWSDSPLPVELSSFSVNKTALGAKLIWSTATETNNNGFAIERSSDKAAWSQIGFVAGKGTTTEKQSYSFVDSKASGTVYYRLKQIDNDGKTSFSSVETVTLVAEKFELLNNTPNPFNPSTTIRFALPAKAFVRVSVSNILGQEVAVLANQEFDANPSHEILFDASRLTSGIYFYTVTANGKSLTKSMTLMK